MQKACSHGEREKRVNISSGGEWSTYGAQKREKKGWKIMFDLKLKTWPHPSRAKQRERRQKWKMTSKREQRKFATFANNSIWKSAQLQPAVLCLCCWQLPAAFDADIITLDTDSHLFPEHCNVLEVLQYSLNDDNRFYWMTISPTQCDSTGKEIYNFDLRNSRKCRHPAGVRTMSVNNVDRAAIVNCLWFSISHSHSEYCMK